MATVIEARRARNGEWGLYEALEGACFRAPILPIANSQVEAFHPMDLNVNDPILRYALTIASPSLIAELDRAHAGADRVTLDTLRSKVLRYMIRMRSRPTPFGLFAGVAMARWGRETDLKLNGIDRVRIRPDMEWLVAVVHKLETREAIRRNLVWMTNPASFISGGRVYLEERTSEGHTGVSVRATPVVMRALKAASEPIPYSRLVALLTAGASPDDTDCIDELLGRLWKRGMMFTDLMPSTTVVDPLHHVIEKLRPIPQAKTICLRLDALAEAIRRCEAAGPSKALELHQYAVAQAKLIANVGPANPLELDCSLSLVGDQIHREVARRAALAAEVLLRVGGLPQGPRRITRYRQTFLARYGRHREVPLLELLSPNWGLGPLGAPTQMNPVLEGAVANGRMRRADTIQQLALRAVHERKLHVVLDDAMLARLEHEEFDIDKAPWSLDLHISVIAEKGEAIDRGNFWIAIAPSVGVVGAGRYWARFTDLFGQDLNVLRRNIADREQHCSSERIVELNYFPTQSRAANVCICPAIRDYQITYGAVSCGDAGKTIPLNEIMVSVSEGRFLMRWSRGDCFLRFCAGHMLNASLAPQVIQFLLEASQDGVVQLGPFDWGAYAIYPMLPRLEYRGIVLCPARWRLKAPTETATDQDVHRYIMAWRTGWNVPRQVYLSAGDNRLLLDLDDSEQLREVARELRRLKPHETSIVEEALPGPEHAWVKGINGSFVSELIVSLIKRNSGTTDMLATARQFPRVSREQRLKGPGEDWVYLKVYIPTDIQDDVLCGPLRDLAAEIAQCSQIDKWFFVRYADPDPHLRLRFRGLKDWLNRDWLPRLLAWGKLLIERGLCDRIAIDTYSREIERYGGLASIDCVETLFNLDTLSVLKLLEQVVTNRARIDMRALAIATLDDFYHALAPDAATAVQWLRKIAAESRKLVGEEYRKTKATLLVYARERCSSDPLLAAMLRERREEIMRIGRELRMLEASAALSVSMEDICASLGHMHLNRLFPLREFDEGRLFGLLARTRELLWRNSNQTTTAKDCTTENTPSYCS